MADYVAWGSGNPDITVAQLLSNSSGLPGLIEGGEIPDYACQFLVAGDIEDCAATIFNTPHDDAGVVLPDTMFRYGGAQWQVAGGVAEAVSGKSWEQLVDEIYVEPCELEILGYNNHFTQFVPGGLTIRTTSTEIPARCRPPRTPAWKAVPTRPPGTTRGCC
ncbi:MAG TPA: serine hydrolase domain-containing protein [Ilumatobacter sp.]|nr:serine hydrolase domain-containing protein [Ilumatobacter sp.]